MKVYANAATVPYLLCHICKGIRAHDGITDHEDMCACVAERSESIIIFTASGVV